jgi:hypothetical protein
VPHVGGARRSLSPRPATQQLPDGARWKVRVADRGADRSGRAIDALDGSDATHESRPHRPCGRNCGRLTEAEGHTRVHARPRRCRTVPRSLHDAAHHLRPPCPQLHTLAAVQRRSSSARMSHAAPAMRTHRRRGVCWKGPLHPYPPAPRRKTAPGAAHTAAIPKGPGKIAREGSPRQTTTRIDTNQATGRIRRTRYPQTPPRSVPPPRINGSATGDPGFPDLAAGRPRDAGGGRFADNVQPQGTPRCAVRRLIRSPGDREPQLPQYWRPRRLRSADVATPWSNHECTCRNVCSACGRTVNSSAPYSTSPARAALGLGSALTDRQIAHADGLMRRVHVAAALLALASAVQCQALEGDHSVESDPTYAACLADIDSCNFLCAPPHPHATPTG